MFESIAGFFIRTLAFVSKELAEILRQTRLLLTLVLGPFLILLVFGLGFRNEARVLRTVFVVPGSQAEISSQVQNYATSLGPQLDFQGIVADETQALLQLTRGQIDAVVVVPGDAESKIKHNEQPVVRVYHREVDPYQVSYVEYVAQLYVDELNRRVLRSVAEQGQQESGSIQETLQTARASAQAMRLAYEQNDANEAQRQRVQMNDSMDEVTVALGASLGVLQGVEDMIGPNPAAEETGSAGVIMEALDSYNTNNASLESAPADKTSYSDEAARAAQIEQDLERLDGYLQDFRSISAQVLVSPFVAEAASTDNLELNASDFFAPGVIILLLQHLLVTFAALSIVRERNSGTMELFRVAPVTAFETLLGKYISYFIIGSLLGAAISALVVFVLGVPMLGSWVNLAGALAALMFAGLGLGFVISLVSQTTSQAVQLSMLVLLVSIFFSGFFLDLRLMWEQIRFLSWGIPATYALRMLQEIMFRANPINITLMGGLLGIGALLFILSWWLLNRQMRLA